MAKSNYTAMVITQVEFELKNGLLSGSISEIPMTVNQVEVDPLDNGFGSNPFTIISFE